MQRARVSNHPCHRLSVPAAKRFWCRHCMMVFEDAITRWRHSRSCRSGGFDNFVRRREIETQALQKMAETLDPDMMTQISVPSSQGGSGSKDLCCFICRQRFNSLDEMREHVKYPCNKPVTLPRPSMTVYIEEPTFGTGIQQHYTEATPSSSSGSHHHVVQSSSSHQPEPVQSGSKSQPVTVYMNDAEQGHPSDSEAKPTNIYVNEKGETVIEVENLDLNTKSGELSLAHLLTQLSQQGIVFDQQGGEGGTEVTTSEHDTQVSQEPPALPEVDFSQPTAVDAANTLTQLAGSMYRQSSSSSSHSADPYTYQPPLKRIKSETVETEVPQYHATVIQHAVAPPDVLHPEVLQAVQNFVDREDAAEAVQQGDGKYIICTSESEVISVVRAQSNSPDVEGDNSVVYENAEDSDNASHVVYHQSVAGDNNSGTVLYHQGEVTEQVVETKPLLNAAGGIAQVGESVLYQGQDQQTGVSVSEVGVAHQGYYTEEGQQVEMVTTAADGSHQVQVTTAGQLGQIVKSEQIGGEMVVTPHIDEEEEGGEETEAAVVVPHFPNTHGEDEASVEHIVEANANANSETVVSASSGQEEIVTLGGEIVSTPSAVEVSSGVTALSQEIASSSTPAVSLDGEIPTSTAVEVSEGVAEGVEETVEGVIEAPSLVDAAEIMPAAAEVPQPSVTQEDHAAGSQGIL